MPSPQNPNRPPSPALFLAWRGLAQHRTRTALSGLAVALGAAMVVAGDVVSGAIVNALTQSEDVRAVAEGLFGQIDPMLKGIGGVVMLAAGFLIFNAFGMSVTQRRQQIGALRALGMTAGQVLRLVLVEAWLIGGAGTAVGVLAGPALGSGIVALLKAIDSPVLGAFDERGASPLSFVLAIALGLGVTSLAALVPARQAARHSPLAAITAPEGRQADQAWPRLATAGLSLQFVIALVLVFAPPARRVQYPVDILLTVAFGLAWIGSLAMLLPASVGWLGRAMAAPLGRLGGAAGRLMADNFRRGRSRVLLTTATLAVGLTFIIGLAGFFKFYFDELFRPALDDMRLAGGWIVSTFDIRAGVGGYADLQSLRLPRDAGDRIRRAVEGRAETAESYFVIVPELSYFYDAYFSFVLDPRFVRGAGSFYFEFTEGGWETALPILDSGCGLLVAPAIARRNNAGLGQTITVTGQRGPVDCVIAGVGRPFVGASIIGQAARQAFVSGEPFALYVAPRAGVDRTQLAADLNAAAARQGLHSLPVADLYALQTQVFETIPVMFNGFLLLAIVAAALGVVNTTLLSVTERRREFGLLRAVGATRAQVRAVVVGEAALIGVLGGGLGMAAGIGLVVCLATVYGANAMGVVDYQPWPAALRSILPAVWTGIIAGVASPLVCAVAAYLPARSILRGAAVESLRLE